MRNLFSRLTVASLTAAAALTVSADALAIGWPADYEGVMLQGFYWDSYTDTKWTNLEAQADELSKYFKLIWIPNSGHCGSSNNMGYMPQYWFTNHNSSFGTEAELLSMIQTYKAKGTGFIADCVINHRNGVTNWYDFPTETWNGQTWSIGLDGICKNDEMASASGQPNPTGNYDTGENFDGCRDLDHTNANVQNNCKNYVKCLQDKYGYAGMRYDMVKGYSGKYNKIYNEYANVEYSVGEYWDGSYDAVAGWIEATGKTSAAFDFPCKYAINKAFSSGDMTNLVWKANGTTDQPAGMIHFGYSQYAVTFVDNHDTYRDNYNKFNGNVVAANAFILMSPGTPCVFLPHYKANKAAIQKLIEIRNAVGIHNNWGVKVLRSTTDCYMAEVTGSKGKAVVKIGSAQVSPDGYTNSDIKASGNDYCVWTKTDVGGGDDPTPGTTPAKLYLLGNVKGAQWSTSASPEMTKSGDKFTITATFQAAAGETVCYFNLSDALAEDWDALNMAANRYGAAVEGTQLTDNTSTAITAYLNGVDASGCKSWTIAPGTYDLTADFSNMTLTIGTNQGGGDDPIIDPTMPAKFYVIGEVNGKTWAPNDGVEMTKKDNLFYAHVTVKGGGAQATEGYFSFAKSLSSKDGNNGGWDELNASGNRFAPTVDTSLATLGQAKGFVACSDGNNAKAFSAPNGEYTIVVNWPDKTARLEPYTWTGVDEIVSDEEAAPVYFNLQGQRVDNPEKGIYIMVRGTKATKVIF